MNDEYELLGYIENQYGFLETNERLLKGRSSICVKVLPTMTRRKCAEIREIRLE